MNRSPSTSNLSCGTGFQPVLATGCEKNFAYQVTFYDAPLTRAGSPCHKMPSCWFSQCVCLLFLLTGCHTERIPTYPPMSSTQAMEVLAKRSRSIHSISAQALLTLTRDDGDTVRLDAALVMQPPDRVRLRAWKFGRAVFDMTLTPEGLWLIAPQEGDRRKEILAAGANTGTLTREWMRLMTGAFDLPGMTVEETAGQFRVKQIREDGSTLLCEIDRKTLTPRRYALKDRDGILRFELRLDRYMEIVHIVWPRRIEAKSSTGNILIELHDVEINGSLTPAAFRPPARAEKMSGTLP